MENTASGDAPQSWLLDMMRRTHLIHQLLAGRLAAVAGRADPLRFPSLTSTRAVRRRAARRASATSCAFVILLTAYVVWRVVTFVATGVTMGEVGHVLVLGLITRCACWC